jgi:uncharacterized protein (DUF362 family)
LNKHLVSIVKYEKPFESVARAVELAGGLDRIKPGDRVFIKPNIVFWTKSVPFPKWGVITTTRVIEDMIKLLQDHGAGQITIGEGIVTSDSKDTETPAHAFETLGYNQLKKRYGIEAVNVFERPFRKVDLGDGVELAFNQDILDSDLVVDLPVMKTHAQTVVSLGIKNLKGTINVNSRKICHNADPDRNLHFHVARLADAMPPILCVIDGIYSNERGPAFDGKLQRTDLLIASTDILSADLVGAKIMGYDGSEVPHLAHAAANRGRTPDLSEVEVKGEDLDPISRRYEYDFAYVNDGRLPLPMHKKGVTGLSYPKYDLTMCTYCSGLNGVILSAIMMAWQGKPFDEVEILTGKSMQPRPGMKHTVLVGKCMYQAHKNNPDITHALPIKGCPPDPMKVVDALHEAGIEVNRAIFENMDKAPGFFWPKYQDRPEFDESFFRAS